MPWGTDDALRSVCPPFGDLSAFPATMHSRISNSGLGFSKCEQTNKNFYFSLKYSEAVPSHFDAAPYQSVAREQQQKVITECVFECAEKVHCIQ
jgi:hypothetical protein